MQIGNPARRTAQPSKKRSGVSDPHVQEPFHCRAMHLPQRIPTRTVARVGTTGARHAQHAKTSANTSKDLGISRARGSRSTNSTKYHSCRQGHQQQYSTRQKFETRGKHEHWMRGMLDQHMIITGAGSFSSQQQADTEYQDRQISIHGTAKCQSNTHGTK